MRVLVLSDLHLEFWAFPLDVPDVDVVILAGDIHLGVKGLAWARTQFPRVPVLYVLGNHEYYQQAHPRLLEKLRDAASGTNVRVLENDTATIEGVVFHGCTLWTDLAILGDRKEAVQGLLKSMTDYRKIRRSPSYRRIRPEDTALVHSQSVAWLRSALSADGGRHVVVTHHAPSLRSLPDKFKADPLTPAYVSDLELLIRETKPYLWVHGHVHHFVDYSIDATRVVCNPRGYPDEPVSGFNRAFVVEV